MNVDMWNARTQMHMGAHTANMCAEGLDALARRRVLQPTRDM
jgi:hypothetical protein